MWEFVRLDVPWFLPHTLEVAGLSVRPRLEGVFALAHIEVSEENRVECYSPICAVDEPVAIVDFRIGRGPKVVRALADGIGKHGESGVVLLFEG